jgi:methylated-DNA-[protein]-cysteine S-methyltransferase
VFSAVVDSPVGPLRMFAENEGLAGILFPGTSLVDESFPMRAIPFPDHSVLSKAAFQIKEYFEGSRKAFTVPLVLEGTDFQVAVWQELLNVDYGTTISYGGLASRLGSPGKARAVGGAVGRNPIGIMVPCHRVIGAGGGLTGFGGGLTVKRALLDLESEFSAS